MKTLFFSVLSVLVCSTAALTSLEAGQGYVEPAPVKKHCFPFCHCRAASDYKPPRGVYKVCSRRIRRYQVLRHVKLPGGGTTSYTEMVVIYRNHYSDGSTHTWTCVLDGSRVDIGK